MDWLELFSCCLFFAELPSALVSLVYYLERAAATCVTKWLKTFSSKLVIPYVCSKRVKNMIVLTAKENYLCVSSCTDFPVWNVLSGRQSVMFQASVLRQRFLNVFDWTCGSRQIRFLVQNTMCGDPLKFLISFAKMLFSSGILQGNECSSFMASLLRTPFQENSFNKPCQHILAFLCFVALQSSVASRPVAL